MTVDRSPQRHYCRGLGVNRVTTGAGRAASLDSWTAGVSVTFGASVSGFSSAAAVPRAGTRTAGVATPRDSPTLGASIPCVGGNRRPGVIALPSVLALGVSSAGGVPGEGSDNAALSLVTSGAAAVMAAGVCSCSAAREAPIMAAGVCGCGAGRAAPVMAAGVCGCGVDPLRAGAEPLRTIAAGVCGAPLIAAGV